MHHTEHQFSNLGCFSIVDAVAAAVGEGCSADAVGSGSTSSSTDVELRGSCSTNVLLTLAGSAAVQMQHLPSSWWTGCRTSTAQREMLQNRVMLQQIALLEHIPR